MRRAHIRHLAELARRLVGPDAPGFDIMGFLEKRLPTPDDNYAFLVNETLPTDTHACTDIQDRTISTRPEIYDRAVAGHGRDRLTAGHELGHYILHADIRLQRRMSTARLEAFRDPEWQANCRAGELRVSYRYYPTNKSPEEVARLFGASVHAVT